MSTPNVKQNIYQQKINTMINDVNNIKTQLSNTESKVYGIDDTIAKLPARIASIRQMNYRLHANLEEDQLKAASRWATMGPVIKSEVSSRAATLKMDLSSLERDVNNHRISVTFDTFALTGLDLRINTLRVIVYDFSSKIQGELVQLDSILNPITQDLAAAESTVKLTSSASFQWKEGETPILAVPAKDMNEKIEGILTLTNQRIIYENQKEIVLKKTFFIVTEKKIERQMSLERPIGSISKLSKGRVGLLAGAGLFIEFKQGDLQLKLDTKSEEADKVVKYYSLISSGQVDEELNKTKPTEQKPAENRVVSCPKCGAPYTGEIYRGQQTVQCKYCSTIITTQ
jgi:hypothetical protein